MEKLLVGRRLIHQRHILSDLIYEKDLAENPAIISIETKYKEDLAYMFEYLGTAYEYQDDKIFINFMQWFGDLGRHLGFNMSKMKEVFSMIEQELLEFLEQSNLDMLDVFHKGCSIYEDTFNDPYIEEIEEDTFLNYLVNMKSTLAENFVMEFMRKYGPKEVYLKLLQPTLYKVGVLWQHRKITVAKEHYITALIQQIIGKMYSNIFEERIDGTHSMIAVCVGNELHEIGMRMVADFFEMDGWNTYFIGSNLPISEIIKELKLNTVDLLAISLTTAMQLEDVEKIIQEIHDDNQLKHIKVIVGGRVFNGSPNLWKKINADGYALNAQLAVNLGNKLVGGSHES
jgi:methanogenic corrinoid protein MtbC1